MHVFFKITKYVSFFFIKGPSLCKIPPSVQEFNKQYSQYAEDELIVKKEYANSNGRHQSAKFGKPNQELDSVHNYGNVFLSLWGAVGAASHS